MKGGGSKIMPKINKPILVLILITSIAAVFIIIKYRGENPTSKGLEYLDELKYSEPFNWSYVENELLNTNKKMRGNIAVSYRINPQINLPLEVVGYGIDGEEVISVDHLQNP